MDNRTPQIELDEKELLQFFVSHLNRIFCAKNELVEKLPKLSTNAYYLDLRQAIDETVEVVQNQIARMRQMFIMVDAIYTYEACTGLVGLLDEAFQSIGPQAATPSLRDLSILFYLQNIESVEAASFKILMMVADKMQNPELVQLLRECYDEALEDRVLLTEITERYI